MFASEIKALLRHPDILPEVDAEGAAELLLIGPGRTPGQGVFRNVRERLRTFSVDYRENNRYFTAGKFQPSPESAPTRFSEAIPGSGTRRSGRRTASPGRSPRLGGRPS